jgi:site-specific DNA-methyltransferase (adenine-specific)
MIEINKLYNGDCLEVMKDIVDNSIDCIICDLPYGTTSNKWDVLIPFDKLWSQYERVIKDNGAIVLFASQPFTSQLILSNLKLYKCTWYWKKEKGVGFQFAKFQPLRQIEEILIFSKGTTNYYPIMKKLDKPYKHTLPNTGGESINKLSSYSAEERIYKEYTHSYPTNVLEFARESNSPNNKFKHPTKKPIALIEYLIKTYSKEGDLILDNTMGVGTICVGCINTNRNYIGIEMDKEYFNIAQNRINETLKDRTVNKT